MVRKSLLIALGLAALVGCSGKTQIVTSPPIEIPTTQIITKDCPSPPDFELPRLYIGDTTDQSSYEDTAKNLILTIEELKTEVKKLQSELDAYRKQEETKSTP